MSFFCDCITKKISLDSLPPLPHLVSNEEISAGMSFSVIGRKYVFDNFILCGNIKKMVDGNDAKNLQLFFLSFLFYFFVNNETR